MAKPAPFAIWRDNQEKDGHGWTFPPGGRCLGTTIQSMDTADYCVEGLEDKCLIERKGTAGEFCANLFEPRFRRELERMALVPHPYVFLEFEREQVWSYPVGSGIPESRWPLLKATPALFQRRLWEASLAFPTVKFEFVGGRGEHAALSLFKRVADLYGP